jgi:RNA polymerase sigma factor (sigma-70 family)
VKSRDESAFRSLVNRHGRTVLTACRQVLTDPADIDDAFQAAFLVLLKKAKAIDAGTPLTGWLFAVAHRIAVRCRSDKTRRSAREAEAARRTRTTIELPDLSWREAAAVLHAELNALPDKYRLPLLLCSVQGLTRDEAADQLGTTVGAIRGHLERGRALLERRLTKRGVVLSAGLMAVLMGGSRAAGIPPAELIHTAVSAATGNASSGVAALAHGAFPMTTALKQMIPAAFLVGLIGLGFGLGTRPATADEKPTAKAEAKPPEAKERTITGTVVGSDGKPMAGAKVWLCEAGGLIVAKSPAPEHAATTDAAGMFAITRKRNGARAWAMIAATKEGYGPGFDITTPVPGHDTTLRCSLALVTDDVPLEGRVLDLQGKPVVGATVLPATLCRTDGSPLDAWEKAARRSTKEAAGGFNSFFPRSLRLTDGPLGAIRQAKTDTDGRFTLTGLGRDRLVTLRVSGPGIATAEFDAVTRSMTTIRTPQDKLESQYNPRTYHGAKFDYTVEPNQPFVGVVTDKETGKPVPGVLIRRRLGWDMSVQAVTDADGKYKLDGLRTGEQELIAIPPIDTPYHLRVFRAGRPANDQPVTADVELHRGVWVSGTVTDKATGKPVEASISYRPDGYDPTHETIPGYQPRGFDDVTWYVTDKAGKFRVLAVPGKGFVFVWAYREYLTADQVDWQGELKDTTPRTHVDSAPVEIASNWNAIAGVSVPTAGKPAKEYAFTVESGTTLKARITDPDGKPLAGCVVTQRTNFSSFEVGRVETADVEFLRVNTNRPRPVLVLHAEKRLGIRTTPAKSSTEIRLQPTATAKGRLRSEDGKPLANTPVEIRYSLNEDHGFRVTELFPEVMTDEDGRFVVPNLIEGVSYELRWPRPAPKKANDYHQFTVNSGEEKHLGDVTGKRDDQ